MTSTPTKRTFASQEQLSYLASFMYDKPKFSCSSKARYSYGKIERETLWNELAEKLNCVQGSAKNVEQWKAVNLLRRNQSPKRDCNHEEEEYCFEPPSNSANTSNNTIGNKLYASQEQLYHLADFMFDEPKFSCSDKAGYTYSKIERDKLWAQLEEELNGIEGSVKYVELWKMKSFKIVPASTNITKKKRLTENNGLTKQKDLLEIEEKHSGTLKAVRQLNDANTEIERIQADAIRILDEYNAANIKIMESISVSINLMNDSLTTNAEYLINLKSAIDHIQLPNKVYIQRQYSSFLFI